MKSKKLFATGARRIAVVMVAGLAVVASVGSAALADYTDGAIAAKRISMEAGIRIWRKTAWLDDDFLSEVQLGDTYAQENGDNRFYDPVEAYVWYFLAAHSNGIGEHVGDGYARRIVSNDIHRALWHQNKLMVLLTADERQEARNRIVYILSCRGADGFVQLGQIHATGMNTGGGNDYGSDSAETYGALSDMSRSYNSFRDRSQREFNYGREAQARQTMGITTSSVIVPNDGEALTYFHIADAMGHPLAKEYLRGLDRGVRRSSALGNRIADEAAKKASYWSPPFEFYPAGTNASGVPYTDECYVNLDKQRADFGRDPGAAPCRRACRHFHGLAGHRAGRAKVPVLARRCADRAPDRVGDGARDPDGGDKRRCHVAERARRDVRTRHRRAAQLRPRRILVQESRRSALWRGALSSWRSLQGRPRRHPPGPVEGQ